MRPAKFITALDDVVATTTSNQIYVGDFKRVALLFKRAAHGSGNTAFTVTGGLAADASTDPTMLSYTMLIDNVANTNSETNYTHTASRTLSANGIVYTWLDPNCPVTHIAITATETTDGTHSAYVIGWED